jgi:hypothetical protein
VLSQKSRGTENGWGTESTLSLALGRWATVLAGALTHAPARAADLEDRVAELEATTVRKGNKTVSVTLYGQVNKAVLFWDDGFEKSTYVVDKMAYPHLSF